MKLDRKTEPEVKPTLDTQTLLYPGEQRGAGGQHLLQEGVETTLVNDTIFGRGGNKQQIQSGLLNILEPESVAERRAEIAAATSKPWIEEID